MIIKDLKDEDFLNYKKPSMLIATCECDWKCCKEKGYDISICQNSSIAKQPNIVFDDARIIERYINNPITNAIVFSGLEPFKQEEEMFLLIQRLREKTDDDIVIYTGYTENELEKKGLIEKYKQFKNIIIKFGRFVLNEKSHFDEVLGIDLASSNQYAKKIS